MITAIFHQYNRPGKYNFVATISSITSNVYTYVRAYIYLKLNFKHAVLDTHRNNYKIGNKIWPK